MRVRSSRKSDLNLTIGPPAEIKLGHFNRKETSKWIHVIYFAVFKKLLYNFMYNSAFVFLVNSKLNVIIIKLDISLKSSNLMYMSLS